MPRYINDIIIHSGDAGDVDPKTSPYHYIVYPDGRVLSARYVSQAGRHTQGHNAHSIGILCVGTTDQDSRTADQKTALLKLVTRLLLVYDCHIHAYSEYDHRSKSPGFNVAEEYGAIRAQLRDRRIFG